MWVKSALAVPTLMVMWDFCKFPLDSLYFQNVRRPLCGIRNSFRDIILWIGDVQSFPFAGTTVLIAVGVALELMRQIDSQLMLRNYEGFLK